MVGDNLKNTICGFIRAKFLKLEEREKKMVKGGRETKPRFGVAKFQWKKQRRFLLNLPVEYSLAKSNIRGEGPTLNTGEGGLIVYLPERLEVGQTMKLKVFFSSGPAVNAVETISRVVWTNRFKEDIGYRCGVKFIDMDSEGISKLKDFLERLSDLSL